MLSLFRKGRRRASGTLAFCEKEIINCNDLLTRCSNVNTSHLDNRRPCYSEHMSSIKCEYNEILNSDSEDNIIIGNKNKLFDIY